MNNGAKIALLALACFATSISEFAIVGMIDVVAESLGVSIAMAGQLVTAFALSGAIGVPLVTMALSKLDSRGIMTVSLVLVVAGCILTAVVTNFHLMMVSRVLMAIGSGIFAVSCFAIALQIAKPGRQASSIATVTLGFNIAMVLGLPFSRFMVQVLPWTAVFWFVALASAIMIPVIRAIVPPSRAETPVPLKEQLGYLGRSSILIPLALNLFWCSGYAALYSYVSPLLGDIASLSASALSSVLLLFSVSTLVGSKLGGWLCDRFALYPVIIVALAAQILILASLLVLDGPSWLVAGAVLVWGVFAWIPASIINLAVIKAAPEASRITLSLKNSSTQVAYALGAGVGGLVVAGFGTRLLCLLAVIFFAVAIVLCQVAIKNQRSVDVALAS